MNSSRDILHFMLKCELCQIISQKVHNQKEFHYNVSKSSQD